MASPFLKQSIKQASIVIGVFTIVSQAFGLVREALIANYFGTSADYDILLVALAVPLMVASVLFAAIPSASIPYLQGGRATGGYQSIFRSAFFNINSLLIWCVTALVFFLLPLFKGLLTEGMKPEAAEAVIRFSRLFCLLIPLRSYEAIFRSLLHLRHNFVFPSVNAVGFNIAIIVVLITSFASLQSYAFVLAQIAGMLVQTLIVAVPAYLIYKRYVEPDAADSSAFRTGGFLKYLGVIVLIESIGLTIDPFDRYLGGIFLDPGYVSATYYANIIYYIPLRIVIYSLAIAIFPSLSEKAESRDLGAVAALYHKTLAVCVLIVLPAAVFFFLFKEEIIWALFERGRFVLESRMMTSAVLSYYLLGLVFNSAFLIQMRVFYALKSWGFFITVRSLAMALKCLIGFFFIKSDWALALGGGTAALFAFAFISLELFLIFGKKLAYSTQDRALLLRAFLAASATVALFLAMYFVTTRLSELHRLAAAMIVGLAGFAFLAAVDQRLGVSGVNWQKYVPGLRKGH